MQLACSAPARGVCAQGPSMVMGRQALTWATSLFPVWAQNVSASAKCPRQCVRLTLRSVAAELLTANIIVVDSGTVQHAADTCYHCRRPGYIIDGTGSVRSWQGNTVQMPDEHLSADSPGLAMPGWR